MTESTNITADGTGATAKSWMIASVAITLISSIGLLAVVIVPALQRINYKYVLHFFIALAIGALSGDSMLHLLPHAFYESEMGGVRDRLLLHIKQEDSYFEEAILEQASWDKIVEPSDALAKGIVALCGLLLFFLSQRAMLVYGDLTKDRKRACQVEIEIGGAQNVNAAASVRDKRDSGCEPSSKLYGDSRAVDTNVDPARDAVLKSTNANKPPPGESITLKVSSSYGEQLSAAASDAHACTNSSKRYSLRDPVFVGECRRSSTKSDRRPSGNVNVVVDADGDEIETNDVALLTLHQLGTLPPRRSMQIEDRLDISTPLSRDNLASAFGVDERDVEAFSDNRRSSTRSANDNRRPSRRSQALPSVSEAHEEHQNLVHAHGHGDEEYELGHSHAVPHDVRSLITMVILGDGLHNFTDGLAVGVAFAGSIAGGLSTAVAVFCHELPHELGDFAVLLKSGLNLKMALLFNMMSSILSFVGMILGLLIGHNKQATQWVYCLVAGIFLYIALVNMLPELNPGLGQRGLLRLSIVQFCGLLLGIVVMFLIAFFEHDIKSSDIFRINSGESKDSSEHADDD